jgi:hypothetical protein
MSETQSYKKATFTREEWEVLTMCFHVRVHTLEKLVMEADIPSLREVYQQKLDETRTLRARLEGL